MILLKANDELKMVFGRIIKTMGVNVAWNGNFVVLNNFLILSGSVRSLIFNFDNRKVLTNIIELPDREEDMEPVEGNEVLTNVLNMTLYAFGKWGVIKGLKVDQDYSQLNGLFYEILKDMNITPGFRDDNFRFYKERIQITYEETVQDAIVEGKRKAQEAAQEEKEQPEEQLGLWHKIRWEVEQCSFSKSELTAHEKHAARLGKNFYRTGFHCAQCQEKLFMVVYPEGEEFLVETEEGKVYLARCYTCSNCNSFYTPRPGKLLNEGDVYALKFGSDKEAYEDYQELLGNAGERTTNYHFNEYEWEYGKIKEPETIERACAEMEDMSEEELQQLDGKLEADFYPLNKAAPYRRRIQELLKRKRERQASKHQQGSLNEENSSQGLVDGKSKTSLAGRMSGTTGQASKFSRAAGNQDSAKSAKSSGIKINGTADISVNSGDANSQKSADNIRPKETGVQKDHRQRTQTEKDGSKNSEKSTEYGVSRQKSAAANTDQVQEKYDARMKVLERMSLRQLQELKKQVQSDAGLDYLQKEDYNNQIAQAVVQKEDQSIRKKAEECRDKPYAALVRVLDEVDQSQASEAVKSQVRQQLEELKEKQGKIEAEKLIASLPANVSSHQYRIFREKLAQYDGVDVSAYEQQLQERRKQTQKIELDNMLRRVGRSDKKGLRTMLSQLEQDFSEEDAAPMRKEIEGRLRKLEEAEIDKICPNILGMTFDEAAEAYEKIEGGAFLPDLKTNTLEMIDKRLTKIKMDECALLVEKLKEDLSGKIKDSERLHFYEARKVMRGDYEPQEAELTARALNTYAADRSRYEFPILICDSSSRKNGKEGFLLTPDHIYYNSTFNSEKIPVRAISGVQGNTGLLNRGIYLNRANGAKTKIPGGIPAKELGVFGEVLNQFIAYLQEKPESRSISYLVQEKHEVKCCYRCGFTYRGGNVCPKCGNQANQ